MSVKSIFRRSISAPAGQDVEHSVRVDEAGAAPSAVTFSITQNYLKGFYFFFTNKKVESVNLR